MQLSTQAHSDWHHTGTSESDGHVPVQALGPVMSARIQVEIQFSDHLSLANAVELHLSGTSAADSGKQLQQLAATHHQHQQTQQSNHRGQQQPLQQLLPELQPPAATPFSSADFLSDFGSLSPARSSQLFGSLDFLHDLGLSPGNTCHMTGTPKILATSCLEHISHAKVSLLGHALPEVGMLLKQKHYNPELWGTILLSSWNCLAASHHTGSRCQVLSTKHREACTNVDPEA